MGDEPSEKGFTRNVVDVPHAPFIYFEGAPLSGHVGGMIRVTLSAERVVEQKSVIATDQVVVAYLRTNVHGARELIEALRRALLLAVPVPDGKAN